LPFVALVFLASVILSTNFSQGYEISAFFISIGEFFDAAL